MADNKQQLEIDLGIEEKPAEEQEIVVEADEAPAPEAQAAPEVDPMEAVRELRAQLDRERQARHEAEQAARRAAEQANAAYSEMDDTNVQLVVSAIDKVKTDNGILTSQYADAMQSGEYEKAAAIQATISANSARLVQLENGLSEMQRGPKRAPIQPLPSPQQGSMLDEIINRVSPRSANWLRDNRDSLNDDRMVRRMFRAHEDAVDEGIELDSDTYFRFIETRLGFKKAQEAVDPTSAAAKPMQRSAPPAAAPVNRGNGTRPGVVKLSGVEAETAKVLGMTEKEYATHKLALQREGKLPN